MTESAATTFEPVNMVERQLVAAANGDTEAQKAFERFILDETLFVATPDMPQGEGYRTLEADTTVRLLNVTLQDGRQAAAIFTSRERVHEAYGAVGYLALKGRDLFEIIRTGPAVLNPGQSYGVVWEPETLSAMLGLSLERVIAKETQVMLGSPADPPLDLIERLRTHLPTAPGIRAAWLALAMWPAEQSSGWYLDVRTTDGDRKTVQKALQAALDGADTKGLPLDMIIDTGGQGDGVGIPIIKPTQPAPPAKSGLLKRLFG